MENATEALIMSASVLLLIVALSISISSFTTLRVQFDDIIDSREQTQYAKDDSGYLNYLKSSGSEYARTVQAESIVSALRRLRKENYEVYIYFKGSIPIDLPDVIKRTNFTVYKIDDDTTIDATGTLIKFTLVGEGNKYVETYDKENEVYNTILGKLYFAMGTKEFSEYYGIYQYETNDGVLASEKTDYKLITFVEK